MIISDKYKYVFIEVPRTGSEAIRQELIKYYDGYSIKKKHALFNNEKKYIGYYIFAGKRNPVEKEYSKYFKYKHRDLAYFKFHGKYKYVKYFSLVSNYIPWLFVSKFNISFQLYLKIFFVLPYVDPVHFNESDAIKLIRTENIQDDFHEVLNELNIQLVRPLPLINKTIKDDFNVDYTNSTIKYIFNKELALGGYYYVCFKNNYIKYISEVMYTIGYLIKATIWKMLRK